MPPRSEKGDGKQHVIRHVVRAVMAFESSSFTTFADRGGDGDARRSRQRSKTTQTSLQNAKNSKQKKLFHEQWKEKKNFPPVLGARDDRATLKISLEAKPLINGSKFHQSRTTFLFDFSNYIPPSLDLVGLHRSLLMLKARKMSNRFPKWFIESTFGFHFFFAIEMKMFD